MLRVLLVASTVFFGVLVLYGLYIGASTLFVRVSLNVNEGWNALHAQRAMTVANPYIRKDFGNFLNYPPLSFYLIGAIGKVTGDLIFTGRVIALLSLVAVSFNIYLASRAMGAERAAAILAGLIFPIIIMITRPTYIGMNDPQLLASAIQTTALPLLLHRANRLSARTVIIAALIMLVGGLIKHNLFALPAAVTLWLLFVDRRAFLIWVATGLIGLLVIAAACFGLFGRAVFDQIFEHQRVIDYRKVANRARGLKPYLPYIGIALVSLVVLPTRRNLLLGLFGVISIALGIVLRAGDGVSTNVYFDILVAVGPMCAVLFSSRPVPQERRRSWRPYLVIAALVAAVLPIVFSLDQALANVRGRQGTLTIAHRFDDTIKKIDKVKGLVICENLAICYWAGHASGVDFFNYGELVAVNRSAANELIADLKKHRFKLVEVRQTLDITKGIKTALESSYEKVQSRPVALWMPKPAESWLPPDLRWK